MSPQPLSRRGPYNDRITLVNCRGEAQGYRVRFPRLPAKLFSASRYGSWKKALAAAREYRDRIAAMLHLPPLRSSTYRRVPAYRGVSVMNKSGIVGVCLENRPRRGKDEWAWVASWTSDRNKREKAWFSVQKHGYIRARELAMKARREAIAKINR